MASETALMTSKHVHLSAGLGITVDVIQREFPPAKETEVHRLIITRNTRHIPPGLAEVNDAIKAVRTGEKLGAHKENRIIECPLRSDPSGVWLHHWRLR